jgi:hypothetical protein
VEEVVAVILEQDYQEDLVEVVVEQVLIQLEQVEQVIRLQQVHHKVIQEVMVFGQILLIQVVEEEQVEQEYLLVHQEQRLMEE